VEQTNPIKDIVFENFEQEVLINKLLQKLSSKEKEIENQRRFKRNKELICRNHLSVRIYHYRDNIGKPRITVCAIYDKKENKYHRGVSFCSFLDNVSKESGRDIAEDRAIKAMKTKQNSDKISRAEVYEILNASNNPIIGEFKSAYDIEMTPFEKYLFTSKKKRN